MAGYKKQGYNNSNRSYSNYNSNGGQSQSKGKKYESKSHAEIQLVEPSSGQKFEPFKKIFAWKTTKRFGFISLQAYKNKDQKILSGEPVADGYEKWYADVKTGVSTQRVSCLFNVRKKILFFELGTQKCAVSPTKGYFSFLTPDAVKNNRNRR
ncbi:hypothetical protein [Flavobacterium aquiphilum]|uniref:hypothetical protein n=1 Tax=Flavobacterium aquiphilum TaxID=3003261 RepID=UPI002480F182|nr:hypothetical protein [Flavobacterium aquiphilum]